MLRALTMAALAASGSPAVPMMQQLANCSMVKRADRVDCGHPGITEKSCLQTHGCCYGGGSATVPDCYYSTPGPHTPPFTQAIKTVHVVQSCHLDVGFADTCASSRSLQP